MRTSGEEEMCFKRASHGLSAGGFAETLPLDCSDIKIHSRLSAAMSWAMLICLKPRGASRWSVMKRYEVHSSDTVYVTIWAKSIARDRRLKASRNFISPLTEHSMSASDCLSRRFPGKGLAMLHVEDLVTAAGAKLWFDVCDDALLAHGNEPVN